MNAEQRQRASQLVRSQTEEEAIGEAFALLQELIEAPEPEPFGYFKAEPFGWTDCSETDEGAIALYTATPANYQSEQHLEMVNAQAPSVPDGWRAVPLSATVEMRNAGRAHLTGITSYSDSKALQVYGAMLAAAPTPAEAPADVAKAVAAEREACAKACEQRKIITPEWQLDQHYNQGASHCAAAIRARGEKGQS